MASERSPRLVALSKSMGAPFEKMKRIAWNANATAKVLRRGDPVEISLLALARELASERDKPTLDAVAEEAIELARPELDAIAMQALAKSLDALVPLGMIQKSAIAEEIKKAGPLALRKEVQRDASGRLVGILERYEDGSTVTKVVERDAAGKISAIFQTRTP